MPGHKTEETVAVLKNNQVPYHFSASASFLAIPVEGVFFDLKMTDFRERSLPDNVKIITRFGKHPSKKEKLLAQVATYLLNLKLEHIHNIFRDRLMHFSHFLTKKKI